MKYVVILLLGILLGAGAAIYFLGPPRAKSMQGQAVQPPAQGGNPPGTIVIALEQSFIDAVLATTFSGLGTPTFQLGQNRNGAERIEQALQNIVLRELVAFRLEVQQNTMTQNGPRERRDVVIADVITLLRQRASLGSQH